MTSHLLRPGLYGKAMPWHVQQVARADRAAARAARRRAADAEAAAVLGPAATIVMIAAAVTAGQV